jgi:dipeptidase D
MTSAIADLKPEGVWKYFAEISKIPRGSKNEAAISRYVLATAKSLGLAAKADAAGNVAAKKPASPGRENVRSVCLQGHMDMVCEKVIDKSHNFLKDPIELVRKDNIITANGTTLGADNGVAVATNLALMADKSVEHGPLEFLFTVDEETGLTGANNLQPGFVESRILLNLDSEEEWVLCVGCAGGKDTTANWRLERDPSPAKSVPVQIQVKGLRGGHSGIEIDKGCGNAIKILNRVFIELDGLGARLASINGGNKHNAIPRDANALLFVPGKNLEAARDAVERIGAKLKAENATVDPGLSISMTNLPGKKAGKVIGKSLQKRLLQTITAMPHGVVKMSPDLPGLVQTSTNLAIIQTSPKTIRIHTSQRSSVPSELDEMAYVVRTVFRMGGAEAETSNGYPSWKPDMDSEILKITKNAYVQLNGKEPEVKAVHAGLECGIIGEKYPGMDMVSFGPTLEGVHTPDERIYIDTVERFWNLLLRVLQSV